MSTPPVAADAAPAFLTVEEAAEILRVNRKTLYEAIRLEQVPGVARIGKTLRIRRAALLEWTAGKALENNKLTNFIGRAAAPRGSSSRHGNHPFAAPVASFLPS